MGMQAKAGHSLPQSLQYLSLRNSGHKVNLLLPIPSGTQMRIAFAVAAELGLERTKEYPVEDLRNIPLGDGGLA